jgi:hypothetical protein
MNQGQKDKWRPPKNVDGIMFFVHNNIIRTNSFSMGDYVLRFPKAKQENKRKFFKQWLEPHPFEHQQTKTLHFLHSTPKRLKAQIQGGRMRYNWDSIGKISNLVL